MRFSGVFKGFQLTFSPPHTPKTGSILTGSLPQSGCSQIHQTFSISPNLVSLTYIIMDPLDPHNQHMQIPPLSNPSSLMNESGLINASGTLTSLGGCRTRPEVIQAMAEIAGKFVSLEELHIKAGEHLASIIGVEAALVTAGAAAALALAVAACITRG